MKLILDTDPGIDDAMAFYYAHMSEGLELHALTTVFGNVTTADATQNALWLGESVGVDMPVYPGAERPLQIVPNEPSDYVHGPHGFGDVEIKTPLGRAQETSAAAFLAAEAAAHPGEITVCAVGPLTNIALAIEIDPNFVANLKQLVIMGGSLDAGGNVSAAAEANFWNDPHAAQKVLTAPGGGEIVIVGLDVTTKVAFGEADYTAIAQGAPKAGGFLKEIGAFYMRFYESVTGAYQAFLHDPAAVIAVESPELFEMVEVPLNVVVEGEDIGGMVRDESVARRCKVCIGVQDQDVLRQYIDVTSRNH